jgi:hypothetical protein
MNSDALVNKGKYAYEKLGDISMINGGLHGLALGKQTLHLPISVCQIVK